MHYSYSTGDEEIKHCGLGMTKQPIIYNLRMLLHFTLSLWSFTHDIQTTYTMHVILFKQ